jgi:hypothetical protein
VQNQTLGDRKSQVEGVVANYLGIPRGINSR